MKISNGFKELSDRLGSMSLAIVLLMVLAVASVIGTVLFQNQSDADYLTQFGPLWYWVFRSLGLFDMYHTGWFLGLLGFLMLSLSVCLWRNTPRMLKEMRGRKVYIKDKSLQHFHHLKHWRVKHLDLDTAQSTIKNHLIGWEIKTEEHEGRTYIRADKGRWNKWGYMFVHSAILVILVGGWVSVHYGIRGTMNVVEGGQEDTISFLKDGETQTLKLPFSVHCEKFFIDFYPTGMPKAFRSTLSIFDHGKEVIHKRDIIVNDPLSYKGMRIYQASFGDGGSKVQLKLFHMDDGRVETVKTRVYSTWKDPKTGISIEITNFRPFNIENMANPGEPKDFKDLGPAVEFILRGPGLNTVKVKTFQQPFEMKGRNAGALMMVSMSGEDRDYQPFSLGLDFTKPKEWALFQSFTTHLAQHRAEKQKEAGVAAFKEALKDVFGNTPPDDVQEMGMRILQAMNNLTRLPWPFIPMLADADQLYYTGLEVARDPGMNIVWIGSALLVIGLCVMLYMPHRKLWWVLKPEKAGLNISLGGMSNRNLLGFEHEFNELFTNMEQAFRS